MKVKTIVDEDFVNYKKPSMLIGCVSCNGKCCIEAGIPLSVCQNDGWRLCAPVEVEIDSVCRRYLDNQITQAVVFGGLEPFEQIIDVYEFIRTLREDFGCNDDVVIYTGYTLDEVREVVAMFAEFENVVIKFGRFLPNQRPHFDEILGVNLASDNQYAIRIS